MTVSRSLLAASFITALGLSVLPATPARAADELGGNPVPGVCMLSREAVFAQSKVGQAASERLGQLADQSRNQLASQRKPIEADIQSFQQKATSLSEAARMGTAFSLAALSRDESGIGEWRQVESFMQQVSVQEWAEGK